MDEGRGVEEMCSGLYWREKQQKCKGGETQSDEHLAENRTKMAVQAVYEIFGMNFRTEDEGTKV